MNYFSSDFTLGILGGGQLGKMLLQVTSKLSIKTNILDPNKDSPCKNLCYLCNSDYEDFCLPVRRDGICKFLCSIFSKIKQ